MSEIITEEPERETTQPSSKRWWGVGKRVWAVIGVIATLSAIAGAVRAFWPQPDLGITFTYPSPDALTSVGCVFTAFGRGSPPAGQDIVLSNQQQGTSGSVDPTMYFAVATIHGNTWQMVVQVGSNRTPIGTSYTLAAWLVDAAWVKYLTQVDPHPRWWGTPEVPPGATEIRSMNVTRTAGKCS